MSESLEKRSARSFFRRSLTLDRLAVFLFFVATGIGAVIADYFWFGVFSILVALVLWCRWSFSDWKEGQENDESFGSFLREIYNDGPFAEAIPEDLATSERDERIQEFVRLYSTEVNGPKEKMPQNVSPFDVAHFVGHNPVYVDQLMSLPRYEAVKDLPAIPDLAGEPLIKSEFCVALGRVFLWRGKDKKSIHANVFIPKNPYIAYDKGHRDKVEKVLTGDQNAHPAKGEVVDFLDNADRSHAGPFLARVAAGGAITILKFPREDETGFDSYIAVGQKDGDAGVDKFKLIPQSGISEHHGDYKDWTDPRRLVAGECVEEIRIVDEDNRLWYRPMFDTSNGETELDARVYITITTRFEALRKYREKYCRDNADIEEFKGRPKEWMHDFKPAPARIIPLGNGSITILYDSDIPATGVRRSGYLTIDPEIGVVDLMEAVIIEISKPLSELKICDGEIHNGGLLWRNFFLFTPKQFLNLINGLESTAKFFGDVCDWPGPGGRWWRANVDADLSREPWMAIPLKKAARRLFKVAASNEDLCQELFGAFRISEEEINPFNGDGEKLVTDLGKGQGRPDPRKG